MEPASRPASSLCQAPQLGGLRFLVKRPGLLVDLEDRQILRGNCERDHSRDEPLGPHLVDLRLEVLDVLVDEVREAALPLEVLVHRLALLTAFRDLTRRSGEVAYAVDDFVERPDAGLDREVSDRKSTRLNSSHLVISYAVFCLKK